eukprot:7625195-Ditylum_brightwellii.AAC.1
MRKTWKSSQIQNMIMMTPIMKTQMMNHRIKTKTHHQFSPVELTATYLFQSSTQWNSLTSFKSEW